MGNLYCEVCDNHVDLDYDVDHEEECKMLHDCECDEPVIAYGTSESQYCQCGGVICSY